MKFNKKFLTYGILGILAVSLVSAALVGYLSNKVVADITVESPMRVGVSLGEANWGGESYPQDDHNINDWTTTGTLTIPNIYGGESITLYTMSENLADVTITAHEEIRVYNPSGITCDDFESITSRFDSIYGGLGYGRLHTDIPGDCHNVVVDGVTNPNLIEIWDETDTSTWSAETDVAQWTITFKTDALGDYTFTYQVIPA